MIYLPSFYSYTSVFLIKLSGNGYMDWAFGIGLGLARTYTYPEYISPTSLSLLLCPPLPLFDIPLYQSTQHSTYFLSPLFFHFSTSLCSHSPFSSICRVWKETASRPLDILALYVDYRSRFRLLYAPNALASHLHTSLPYSGYCLNI